MILTLSLVLIICGIFCTAMVFPSQSGVAIGETGGGNAKATGSKSYVTKNTTNNEDYIINTYNFELNESTGNPYAPTIKLGTQLETEDYIYTYGYYWGSKNTAPTRNGEDDIVNDLTDWEKMPNNIGWGVAAKDRDKDIYEDLYAVINETNVTYITNCFAYCNNLRIAPILPNYTVDSTNAFYECVNLSKVVIPMHGSGVMSSIDQNMFFGCSGLEHIYIPDNIKTIDIDTIAKSPFYGCSQLKIYAASESKPEDWTNNWNYISDSDKSDTHYNYSIPKYCMENQTEL